MNLQGLLTKHLTSRLCLRPFVTEDLAQYAEYHSRPDVYRYLYAPVPTEPALSNQFNEALKGRFKKDGDIYRLAVERTQDQAVIGEVLLKLSSLSARQAELGYIFNPAFAGKGYATEAAAAMLLIGFERIGFHRIFARIDAANSGSVGVVERLGLRREAHFIQNDCFDGKWGDEYVYAIINSEWDARQTHPSQSPTDYSGPLLPSQDPEALSCHPLSGPLPTEGDCATLARE